MIRTVVCLPCYIGLQRLVKQMQPDERDFVIFVLSWFYSLALH